MSTPSRKELLPSNMKGGACHVAKKRGVALSKSIKEGTKMVHKEAENVFFIRSFLKGNININAYAKMTGNLYHVYTMLESVLAENEHLLFGTHQPEALNRSDRLLDDWRYLSGRVSSTAYPEASPATVDYVERLQKIANSSEAHLLIAHAYTRYMGDLSGGQILARCARKALNLPETGEGGSFYEFPGICPKNFKNMYRSKLDELPYEHEMLVSEANVAFALNIRIFEEIDVYNGVEGAIVRPLEFALSAAEKWKEDKEAGKRKNSGPACPFGFTSKTNMTRCPVRSKNMNGVRSMSEARCPWPFILLHDPKQGFQDWQSWLVIAGAYGFAVSLITSK